MIYPCNRILVYITNNIYEKTVTLENDYNIIPSKPEETIQEVCFQLCKYTHTHTYNTHTIYVTVFIY